MKRFLFLFPMCVALSAGATTYYIDPVNGSEGNNGLGPDASHASNKPWKSIHQFARTNATASGDVAYLAPGVYREPMIFLSNWTSYVKFIGDPQNSQGFKTSGSVLVPPGIVRWTGYTNTDSTASSAASTLDLNGKNYIWLENLYIIASPTSAMRAIKAGSAASTNIVITNCVVVGCKSYAVDMTAAAGLPVNLTIDNSYIFTPTQNAQPISISFTAGSGADWDMGIVIRNSTVVAYGNASVGTAKFGTSTGVGGGVNITNCTLVGAVSASGSSTNTLPVIVRNSIVMAPGACFTAGAIGQIDENYNLVFAGGSSSHTATAVGANSHTNDWSYHLDFAASQLFGFGPRPLFSPLSDSPVVGAGQNNSTVDFYRRARPAGNAFGAFEVHTAPEHSSVSQ